MSKGFGGVIHFLTSYAAFIQLKWEMGRKEEKLPRDWPDRLPYPKKPRKLPLISDCVAG